MVFFAFGDFVLFIGANVTDKWLIYNLKIYYNPLIIKAV
jgi:hypothetical protein